MIGSDDSVERKSWVELGSVEFLHHRGRVPGMAGHLGGFLTRPREDLFRFEWEGKWVEVSLELDAFHRKGEVCEVLERMYRAGVKLQELAGGRKLTFMLTPMPREEVEKAIDQLKNAL